MPYSLKQAAEATGRSKPTILRAIQTGKISAQKDEHGEWQIEPAELHRVYEPAERTGADEMELNDTQQTDPGYETGLLRGEVEQLRQRLEALEMDRERERRDTAEHIVDLRRRLDQADAERREKDRQLTALLTDQRLKEGPRRRWWQLRKIQA
jgi:hypothetical protein